MWRYPAPHNSFLPTYGTGAPGLSRSNPNHHLRHHEERGCVASWAPPAAHVGCRRGGGRRLNWCSSPRAGVRAQPLLEPEEPPPPREGLCGLLLPDGIGTDVIRDLRATRPDVPVLVLTVARGPDPHGWARMMGADEMISKDASTQEIFAAIRILLRG